MLIVVLIVAAATPLFSARPDAAPQPTYDSDYRPKTRPAALERTWARVNGEIYGARPNTKGPIGGGEGYAQQITHGDYEVATAAELIQALDKAGAGEVVYLNPKARIDLTVRVRAEKFVLKVPAGVTLASNRGVHDARGALIYSDEFKTVPLIRATGPHVRITGLRLRGPDPKRRTELHRRSFGKHGRGHKFYYKFPNSDGIAATHDDLEVDNCELYGWSHGAVVLDKSKGHRIHHNFIHHNRRDGLGYGVVLDRARARIAYNLFDYNRHSIAGTGRPTTSYEAADNVVLGHATSHLFDMHGGRDRHDGTDIAGTKINIHDNTFAADERAIHIRGMPQDQARIHGNWFHRGHPGQTVIESEGKTRVFDNVYGQPPKTAPEHYRFAK